jgi:hypothetical protein
MLDTAESFITSLATLLFDLIYFAYGFGDPQENVSVFLLFR